MCRASCGALRVPELTGYGVRRVPELEAELEKVRAQAAAARAEIKTLRSKVSALSTEVGGSFSDPFAHAEGQSSEDEIAEAVPHANPSDTDAHARQIRFPDSQNEPSATRKEAGVWKSSSF